MQNLVHAGGLWVNKDKNGQSYMAGNLGGLRVMVFKNDKKKGEKDPDYRLVFGENRPDPAKEKKGGLAAGDDIPF